VSDSKVVRKRALAFISQHHVVTLATNGPEGLWAAAVFYAHQGFLFFFLSAGTTRHALNIAFNPMVAATIQGEYDDWPGIKGIQLEGKVNKLKDGDIDQAKRLFSERFPFLQKAPDAILMALDKVHWYSLTPDRLFFVDNTQAFGHRDEVPL
jgi:uncharacterized protein YhbP (UPF0306 family)